MSVSGRRISAGEDKSVHSPIAKLEIYAYPNGEPNDKALEIWHAGGQILGGLHPNDCRSRVDESSVWGTAQLEHAGVYG